MNGCSGPVSCQAGRVAVDACSVAGEDHNLGFHYPDRAQLAIRFFGLTAS